MAGDINKLPQWARNEIARLKAEIATADSALSCALGAIETRIEVNPYRSMIRDDKNRCFVSENETIRFYFGLRYIDVKLDGDELSIRGDERVIIEPNSSNVITVKPRNQ